MEDIRLPDGCCIRRSLFCQHVTKCGVIFRASGILLQRPLEKTNGFQKDLAGLVTPPRVIMSQTIQRSIARKKYALFFNNVGKYASPKIEQFNENGEYAIATLPLYHQNFTHRRLETGL